MKPLELMEQGRFLGEEFLLWLWMRSMTEGGASGEDGDGSGCFVDDAIQLVSERGEVKEISLRKGNPSECREAFEALGRGMRPAKVKLRILSGDLEWVFTLNAATLRQPLRFCFRLAAQFRLEMIDIDRHRLAVEGRTGEALPAGEAPWEA